MLRRRTGGQTTLEYLIVIVIILGVFVAIGNYVKRGLQGRWKSAVDELGDQYDPRVANSMIIHTLTQNTNTAIMTMNSATGFWTKRTDETVSSDRKAGYMVLNSY